MEAISKRFFDTPRLYGICMLLRVATSMTVNMLLVNLGIFESFVLDVNAESAARIVFASEYGRGWWDIARDDYAPQLTDLMDAAAESMPEASRMELMLRIKERASQEVKN